MNGAEARDGPRRVWDLVLTVVLDLLLVPFTAAVMAGAGLLALGADPCGAGTRCDAGRMNVGLAIAVVVPIVVGIVAIALSVVLLVRRRIAFVLPLAAALLDAIALLVGAALVVSGVPGATY